MKELQNLSFVFQKESKISFFCYYRPEDNKHQVDLSLHAFTDCKFEEIIFSLKWHP